MVMADPTMLEPVKSGNVTMPTAVGTTVGAADGSSDGDADGNSVGAADGNIDGSADGSLDGICEGRPDGAASPQVGSFFTYAVQSELLLSVESVQNCGQYEFQTDAR
jgi:hypothetical protein